MSVKTPSLFRFLSLFLFLFLSLFLLAKRKFFVVSVSILSHHSHRRLLNRFVNLSFAEMLSNLRAPSALAARYASTRQREGRLGLRRARESEGPNLLFILLVDRNFLLLRKKMLSLLLVGLAWPFASPRSGSRSFVPPFQRSGNHTNCT